ncbi:MAG: efflux RND transporter periplasmic adaptor subunit [Flavobacteriales bacterium]|nr:efflux RND transporter periplasmic adaptor subunit [Flavobacteriales bacterium]
MNIRKTLIIIASAIILLLFGFVSSVSYNMGMSYGADNAESIRASKAKAEETHEQLVKSVLVAKITNSQIKNEINSSGRVVSLNNITISSEVQGRLIGVNAFKKGTEIKKGEVIFSVKNTDLKHLIDAKKSRFMSLVSSNLADIKLDYNTEYAKWERFFNAINIDKSLPDFPEMSSTKEKNYIVSRSILAEYLSVKSDEEKLSKYTVFAPFDGIITKSYSDVGGNVNPGSPVVDFIRKGKMEIELTVNTSEIQFINVGDKVSFSENGNTYNGKVIRKGNFVNPSTQNISVFTSININENSLFNGMYLNATITTNGTDDVCKLPRRAIFEENKVFTVNNDNKLKITEVNIIAYQGDDVIVDNLSDNTLIVSEPLVNISEGTIVKPISN